MTQRAETVRVRTSNLIPVLTAMLAVTGVVLVGCAANDGTSGLSGRGSGIAWGAPTARPTQCYGPILLGAGDPIGARIEEVRLARAALEPLPVQASVTQPSE